jgi:hypothetical protein
MLANVKKNMGRINPSIKRTQGDGVAVNNNFSNALEEQSIIDFSEWF